MINFGRQAEELGFIARTLKKLGLPASPQEAIQALAKTIRDHKHFENLLTTTDPSERQMLYEPGDSAPEIQG